MTALLILNYDVLDRDALTTYRDNAAPVLLGPGAGEVVALSHETVDLPEGGRAGTDTIVLRFDSAERAHQVFHSDAYQALVRDRYLHSTPRSAFIVPEVVAAGSAYENDGCAVRGRIS